MSVLELLSAMDEEQKRAVTLQINGAVAAGAGSGKTKVLASRYVWLVVEKKLKVDEILTLTFTNKAVSEMYSRIYRYLLEQPDIKAKDALKNFHKARISTLDSFSANIARTASARYGISPDFISDETALRDLARKAALRFVMDNRESSAIRALLSDHKIRKLAEEIFAKPILKYSPISSPLKFDEYLSSQKNEILMVWDKKSRRLSELTDNIVEAMHDLAAKNKSGSLIKSLREILFENSPPPLPDVKPLFECVLSPDVKKYFDYYSAIVAIKLSGNYGEDYQPLLTALKVLKGKDKDGLYYELQSITNNAFNFRLCSELFSLMEIFQKEFAAKKRETGILSFNDIAHLAVDALRDHPDIRQAYKNSLRMIMIDEFQDNNALQRDLIYLLAENPDRTETGMPALSGLEKDRMFFVGDEKQSIYRFRGADVSVFRSLGKDLAEQGIELLHNYRSRPGLIAVFNHIFEKVFSSVELDTPAYEAKYNHIKPPIITAAGNQALCDQSHFDKNPLAHFCFLNREELPEDDSEGIKSQDLEAAFIAEKIQDMVKNKNKIPKRKDSGIEWVECDWGDFAVLERSYTHQSSLEKYFREFAVPYNTDRPSGLFNEAPILDLRAYLRLLVYPEDRVAYATLIRSPFTRLSDLTLAACMLAAEARPQINPEPFDEKNESLIPEDDLELYRRARERYRYFREASRTLPVTELITKLWFEEAYRYETLWTESAQVYESLFDLFFSLACESDSRGKSLAEFIEYLEDVINREEKPDDKDIPTEGESGVRILSIHKSKGLEFPVVFIFGCAGSGNARASTDLVTYHEKYGLIIDMPYTDEFPLGGNYFREVFLEEEKAKDNAELKRLLYVAMTRAESRLFLTFTLPGQTREEKKVWDITGEEFNRETIRRRLIQLDENSEGKRDTFLKLLQGILPDCPPSLCSLETIPALSRADISKRAKLTRGDTKDAVRTLVQRTSIRSQRKAALAAATFYERAEIIPEGKARPLSLPASKIGEWGAGNAEQGSGLLATRKSSVPNFQAATPALSPQFQTPNPLDLLLEKAGVSPMDFGSLVHAVLEGRLKGQSFLIPPKIPSRLNDEKTLKTLAAFAESMADNFLSSELGKRCVASGSRESEFSVVTSAVIDGKPIAVAGQIDLLFLEEGEVVVVDFKTDKIECPEEHYAQLAVYCQAAGDIFDKNASAWLYYLRSGRAVNVTSDVKAYQLQLH